MGEWLFKMGSPCRRLLVMLVSMVAFAMASSAMQPPRGSQATFGRDQVVYQAYKGEYYSNKATRAAADLVTVTGQNTTSNINFPLGQGTGSIDGHVVIDGSTTPLPNVLVQVSAQFGEDWYSFWSAALTNSDGYYYIGGLPPGNQYLAHTWVQNAGINYVDEYYRNKNAANADPITVNISQTTHNIDFDLPVGGIIMGRAVRTDNGNPISGAYIYAMETNYHGTGYALTDEEGNYIINTLNPGDYRVYFMGYNTEYVTLYYNQKLSYQNANLVHVVSGDNPPQAQRNINFSVPVGGKISGHLNAGGGSTACNGWYVSAVGEDSNSYASSAMADGSFNYLITGLPSGLYQVTAADIPAYQYHIQVTAPNETQNINFTLCPDTAGTGYIHGRVTNQSTGAGLVGLQVKAFAEGEGYDTNWVCTDANGYYTICGAYPGTYAVRVIAPETRWVAEYYNNRIELVDANLVTVTADQTVNNINFALIQGGAIEGWVYDETTSDPLAYWPVTIDYNTDTPLQYMTINTLEDGSYHCESLESGGLPARTYYVRANHYTRSIFIPDPTPTGPSVPTSTPTSGYTPGNPTPTPSPDQATWTPQPGTATPTPNFTPNPPTPTPRPCTETGAGIWMPYHHFVPGVSCSCIVTVCNPLSSAMSGFPLFVILDVWGNYFFAPSFSAEFDHYLALYPNFEPGITNVTVLPEFTWPGGVGAAEGIIWYAALTDPAMQYLVGSFGMFEFGWGE